MILRGIIVTGNYAIQLKNICKTVIFYALTKCNFDDLAEYFSDVTFMIWQCIIVTFSCVI